MEYVWLWCVIALAGTSTATLTSCPLASPGAAGHWSIRVAASPPHPRPAELKVRLVPTPERVQTSIGQLMSQKSNGDYVAMLPANLTLTPDMYIFITYKDLKTIPLLEYLEINNVRLCYSESMDTHKHVGDSHINNVVKDFLSQEITQETSKISTLMTTDKSNISLSIKNRNSGTLTTNSIPKIMIPEIIKNNSMHGMKTNIKSDFPKHSNNTSTQLNSENTNLKKHTLDRNITNDLVANVSDIVMDRVVKLLHNNMKNCCKGMKNAMSLPNTTQRSIANITNDVKVKPTNENVQTSKLIVTKLASPTSKPYFKTTLSPQNRTTAAISKYSIKDVTVTTAKPINTTNVNKILSQLPQSDKFTNKRLLVNHMQPINISTEASKHSKQHLNKSASERQVENNKDANITSDIVGNISADLTAYIKPNDNKEITKHSKVLQNITKPNDGYLVLNLKLVKPLINVEKDNEVQVYKKIKEMESDLERLDKEIMLRYVESDPDQDAMRKMENDMDKFFNVNNLRKALREEGQFETPTTEDYFTSLETTIPTTYFEMLR